MATARQDGLTAAEFAELRRLKPADAMRWMQERENGALTFSWQDMWQTEHSHHFTVSRLARLDLLQSIQDSLSRSVAGDLSRRDWMRDTEQLLREAGWWGDKQVLDPATGKMVTTRFDPARLKLIFDTNTRQAAAAGQWERIERTRRTHPYLRYITKRDDRVRPAHAAWDNVTLPVTDAFWQTHYPPNGWRCRCRVVAVSEREYQAGRTPGGGAMKKQVPEVVTTEFENRRTGEVSRVPVGVDPGFDYNPGAARRRELDALATAKTRQAAPALARAAQFEGLTLESAAATFYERARTNPGAKQPYLALAPISNSTASQARGLGVGLEGKLIGLDHDGVAHALKHGAARESLRGQVPLTPGDVGLFVQLANMATWTRGTPAVAPDGCPLLVGKADLEGFDYEIVVKVRRFSVVLLTMYKRRK